MFSNECGNPKVPGIILVRVLQKTESIEPTDLPTYRKGRKPGKCGLMVEH